MVMLGHSRCGAVTAAVDSYLQPLKFWSKSTPNTLRLILQRLYMPVREAANGLKEVWGTDVRQRPGYREALIESAVLLNAAQTAYDLRTEVERAGKWEIEVLWGAYNLFTHKVACRSPAPATSGAAPDRKQRSACALLPATRASSAPCPRGWPKRSCR